MKLSLKTPAKINWFLSVLEMRADGYHNIISAMQQVDLFDSLFFESAPDIELISDLRVPVEDNLVYKAAVLIKDISSYSKGAKIRLKKEIPLAAGLGGGSSDAACTLVALNRLWGLGLSNHELSEIGARIGSDVPFFIGNVFSLVEGRGEKVSSLMTKGSVAMLLVKPDISVSAAWAYKNYKTRLTKKHVDIKIFCRAFDEHNLVSLRQMIFNDLEEPVISEYPVVEDIKQKLLNNGAVISSMSGSGPTVFGVFHSFDEAVNASRNMGDMWCRVVRTLTPDTNKMPEM